jgi:hypothetical protein
MTITVDVATGLGYCVGQRLYIGGQWLYIKAKFPVTEHGRVTAFNVVLDKVK